MDAAVRMCVNVSRAPSGDETVRLIGPVDAWGYHRSSGASAASLVFNLPVCAWIYDAFLGAAYRCRSEDWLSTSSQFSCLTDQRTVIRTLSQRLVMIKTDNFSIDTPAYSVGNTIFSSKSIQIIDDCKWCIADAQRRVACAAMEARRSSSWQKTIRLPFLQNFSNHKYI